MIKGETYRKACLITAIANAGGNLGLMLLYRRLFSLLGIPQPVDMHYFFWMAGLSFTNGVLAYLVYRNPEENRPLLKVGAIGKGLFAAITYYLYTRYGLHWFFVTLGVWDGIFSVIFALYLIQLSAPDLAVMNEGRLLEGHKPTTRKAAMFLFSLTGTGSKGAERVKKGLESKGYKVDIIQIKPREQELFRFPFKSVMDFLRIGIRAIIRRPAEIEPLNLPARHDYDLIVMESQTWFVGMSAPIEAVFQDEANRPFFQGRDAAVFIVCRGLWRRSQAMLVRHLQRFGANVIGAQAHTHAGKEPSRLFSLVAYLIYGQAGKPGWLSWFLQPRYGLGDKELASLEQYGKTLAER